MTDFRPLEEPLMRGSNPEMVLIGQHMAHMAADIRELRKEVSDLRKKDFGPVVGAIMILLVGGTGLWGLAINPLSEKINKLPDAALMDEKLSELTKGMVILADRFKDYATKDEVNRIVIDVDRRLPRTR
jgi:hypothetical protein